MHEKVVGGFLGCRIVGVSAFYLAYKLQERHKLDPPINWRLVCPLVLTLTAYTHADMLTIA
jgi:hypothetical protein